MKKKMIMALATITMVSLLVVGGTLAWFTDSETVVNTFTAGDVEITINENGFQDITNWAPGSTENKDVHFENDGSLSVYVRATMTPVWGSMDGNQFVPDESLSNANITLNLDDNDKWTKSGNYYYYKDVLASGASTEKLLDSVTIVGSSTGNAYEGKVLKITVSVEAVQSANDAYKDAWGINQLPFGDI